MPGNATNPFLTDNISFATSGTCSHGSHHNPEQTSAPSLLRTCQCVPGFPACITGCWHGVESTEEKQCWLLPQHPSAFSINHFCKRKVPRRSQPAQPETALSPPVLQRMVNGADGSKEVFIHPFKTHCLAIPAITGSSYKHCCSHILFSSTWRYTESHEGHSAPCLL